MSMLQCELPGIRKVRSGKVREVFDLDDRLLLVATDRISAFDCVLPDPIPGKGGVLTALSAFWFQRMPFIQNHVIETEFEKFPERLRGFPELRGRSMIVKKTEPLPIECVVRSYLAGSAWKEYRQEGRVAGESLPQGIQQAGRLPRTMFTPSTKAESGHDRNITWEECRRMLGDTMARRVRDASIQLYESGREHAEARGILIADTKFEFGILKGELLLIDEALTPDSSRFWPAADYREGSNPPSFDKQFVRDYLESLPWDKQPPAPALPEDIIQKTSEKYREAQTRLTGS